MESTRIVSPSVDSTCQKSICARLRKYSWSGLWGWVKNVVDSSRFDRIDTNRTNRCATEVCGLVLRTRKVHVSLFYEFWLPVGYAGWVENVVDSTRFDRIDTNRFPCWQFVMPEVDLRDATPCESSWDVTCDRHESYESTEVCGHVLRTRKVHVSLFHGFWPPVGYAGWVENVVEFV